MAKPLSRCSFSVSAAMFLILFAVAALTFLAAVQSVFSAENGCWCGTFNNWIPASIDEDNLYFAASIKHESVIGYRCVERQCVEERSFPAEGHSVGLYQTNLYVGYVLLSILFLFLFISFCYRCFFKINLNLT